MSKQLSPAREIVEKFGGVRALARALKISPSAISRWMMPAKKRGTDGHVPQRHWPALLKLADKQRVTLTLHDLVKLK